MEAIGIDSENYLFAKLLEYSTEMLHLISRRQFNDRRKFTANLCIETLFSQMCDQLMLIHNYTKDIKGIFTRVMSKISALTTLQYINKINNKPIGRVKYALI